MSVEEAQEAVAQAEKDVLDANARLSKARWALSFAEMMAKK